jgi:deoxyadenosine/deoxycytidine kinase
LRLLPKHKLTPSSLSRKKSKSFVTNYSQRSRVMSKKGAVLWVEGLIGAGKSTLATKLAGLLEFRAFHEPVEADILEKFYKDPKGEAFNFQIRQLARRIGIHKLAQAEACHPIDYNGAILDRGLPGDRVFAKLHCHFGNISPEQWTTYEILFNDAIDQIRSPALLVFLDVEPDVAMERVKNRNRGAESTLSLDYLKSLRKGYLDLMAEIDSGEHRWSDGIDVMRVPWNTDHQEAGPLAATIKDRLRIK